MRTTFLLVSLALGLMGAGVVSAQCAAPSWQGLNRVAGFDGFAYSAATTLWDPDGAGPASPVLVVGGAFSAIGDTAASGIASWDGMTWQPLGAGLSGEVSALTVYNGELIAGGTFTSSGATSVSNIARWNGSGWQPLGAGVDGGVYALAVFNGELIAGGSFLNAGGSSATRIARWNGATWQTFGPGVGSLSSTSGEGVFALFAYGGVVMIGGRFTIAGGLPANGIVAWNGLAFYVPGTVSYAGAYNSQGWVSAFALDGVTLVVGGGFSSIGGVGASCVARWDGITWTPIGSGTDGPVAAILVNNGEVIVGGSFANAGGSAALRVARWNGSAWLPAGAGIGTPAGPTASNDGVSALGAYGGQVIAVGRFMDAGGVHARCIARWNGTTWQSWNAGQIDGQVNAFTEFSGDLIAGGSAWPQSGVPAGTVQRWSSGVWAPVGGAFDNGAAPTQNADIQAVAVYNGEIYAGGRFVNAGLVPANYVARWTGSAWAPLQAGVSGQVNAMIVFNGDLVVGGGFGFANGVAASRVARWNGTSWLPLGSLPTTAFPVQELRIWNGTLIAATTSLTGAPGVFSWSGSAWTALGTPVVRCDIRRQ